MQTMVQLTEELVALLDAEAARRGISRSAVIRAAVEEHLEQAREASIGRAVVDGYRAVPPATPERIAALSPSRMRQVCEALRVAIAC